MQNVSLAEETGKVDLPGDSLLCTPLAVAAGTHSKT